MKIVIWTYDRAYSDFKTNLIGSLTQIILLCFGIYIGNLGFPSVYMLGRCLDNVLVNILTSCLDSFSRG